MTSRQRPESSSLINRLQLMIFYEGERTESIYLTHWHRLYRDRVIVNLATHNHTTPFQLVTAAADQRRSDLREAKRGRGAAYDQYWCMFDVDEHPRIDEALNKASDNNISIALSSPCLELWFMIHFDDQTAYIDRHDAQKKSRILLGCDKTLTPAALELLRANYEKAKERAQSLTRKHSGDKAAVPWNPHSEVWKLVDVIRGDAVALFQS